MVPRVFRVIVVIAALLIGVHCSQDEKYHQSQSKSSRITVQQGEEDQKQFWNNLAGEALEEQLDLLDKINTNKAKNIIFFLGDGMSLETTAATRVYMGNENFKLPFEKFPFVGLSKTYCVDKQVADSACSSTALFAGVKSNYGTIGMNAKVQRHDCQADLNQDAYTETIAKWAQNDCRATGIVTTSRVTHASPAGLFAHTANRDWENDDDIRRDNCDPNKNTDIARQLMEWDVGSKIKVILGGGRAEFRNHSIMDEESGSGWRKDGRDLIREWHVDRSRKGAANYVWNRQQLSSIDYENTDFLLGLFEADHCMYNLDVIRKNLQENEPTLSDMTEAAIKVLRKDSNGYFLFVEGAKIDMAHHENWAEKALEETKEFAKAVELAQSLTNEEDTLIVVTADHSHTLTYSGYPVRGKSIFDSWTGYPDWMGTDGMPYNTLSYANGLGYFNTYLETGGRIDPRSLNYSNPEIRFPAHVPLEKETHGASDVGVFAVGPWSHLFVGTYEQNNIPLLMAYSAKFGPFSTEERQCSSGYVPNVSVLLITIVLAKVLLEIVFEKE